MRSGMVRVLGVGVLLVTCGCVSQVGTPPVAASGSASAATAPPASVTKVAKDVKAGTAPVAPAVVAPPPRARQLAADEPITTASGSTLTVVKGWFVTDARDLLVVEDPERQAKLAMVELAAPDADAAVTGAWARFQPGFALPVARKIDRPARDGWDAIVVFAYVTAANENRVVQALPRRKGATWYVWLIDGDKAAFERRGGQVATAFRSFKPAGLQRESFAGGAAHPFDAAKQKLLSTFIEQARKDADIPGVAIGIVQASPQGAKLVYQQGFGVKDRDEKHPGAVTPATLFLIGSNTKSLTTLLMARLIDRGVFAWTTPVTQLLPSFALGDAEMTRKLTMQHTVCACTGLPRYDMQFLFEYAGVTPEDRVTSMKTMVPTTGFGETFQYSNLMVAAGGFVAAQAAARPNNKKGFGAVYDDAMSAEVFRPLGMAATTFDFAKAARANHAAPHAQALDLDLTCRRMPLAWEEGVLAARPAGGAWSNVRDMSRYLLVELGKGVTPEGKRVVSEANLLHRREAQVKMSDEASYGLGLMVVTDHGVQVVQHGGNNLGFSSDMYWLPEHGVGVVVLTNAAGAGAGPFLGAVRRRLFELLFDGKEEAAENLAAALAQAKAGQQELAARLKPADAAWWGAVVGAYANPVLGKLSVRAAGAEAGAGADAVVDVGEWRSPAVREVALDGSVNVLTTAPGMQMQFAVGPRTLTLKTPQQDYVFAGVGAAATDDVISDDEGLMMCAEALPKQLECKEDFCAAMVRIRAAGRKAAVDLKAMETKCLEEIAVDGTGDVGTRKGRCAGWAKARPKMEMKRTEAEAMSACWSRGSCKERVECWGPKMAEVMARKAAGGGR